MRLRPARTSAVPISRLSTLHRSPASLSFRCLFSTLHSFVSSGNPWYQLLRRAADAGDIMLGRRGHAGVVASGLSSDLLLSNNLISMYGKCGCLASARLAFVHATCRDTATWNSLLSAYAQHNRVPEGCSLFRLMVQSGVPLSTRSIIPIIKICFGTDDGLILYFRSVHCLSVRNGLSSAPFVASSFVAAYCKHGSVADARRVFDEMDDADRDAVLWNIMINAYAQSSLHADAFLLFSELRRSGACPIDGGLSCILVSGGEPSWHSLQARAIVVKMGGFSDDDVTASPGVVFVWNKTISEHVRAGDNEAAMKCLAEMTRAGVECDYITLIVALSAAAGIGRIEVGEPLHSMALKLGLCYKASVSNTLIKLYSRAGSLGTAREVFDEMKDRDLVSWNSMISSYVQDGASDESVILFLNMVVSGILPDEYTLASIFRALSSIKQGSSLCQQVHVLAAKSGLDREKFVSTALVSTYAKKGNIHDAKLVINNRVDIACLNALISGYVDNGDNENALKLFMDIHRHCNERPNHFTLLSVLKACSGLVAYEQGRQIHTLAVKLNYGSDLSVTGGILDMYLKCCDKESAHACFSRMPVPDDVAWTAMISGSVENGDEEYALSLYHQMRRLGILADEFNLASLIKACSCLTALEQGRQIHANIIKMACMSDSYVATSLMDMYAKCGMLEESCLLFNRMSSRNIFSWNAMVVGLAQHGNAAEALSLFRSMLNQGLKPDKITFVGVLSACSHSGLVSDAYHYFDSMSKDYGIRPELEHYTCLVDVLGRAGRLLEAEKVIETMPFEGSSNMYRALLGACRIKGNSDIAERMVCRLLQLDPLDSSAYVLLSNIYASSNEWDKADQARKLMKKRNVKKDPGYSWVEAQNKVHTFVVDDRSHPDSIAIYKKLEDLVKRIKDEGYIPDTSITLHNVEEEEKESSLYYHSEKLAIGYALLATPTNSRIRVIKNLRVCGDCHNAIKYISKVVDREIIVRDSNRFHHFNNGKCSCGDYW